MKDKQQVAFDCGFDNGYAKGFKEGEDSLHNKSRKVCWEDGYAKALADVEKIIAEQSNTFRVINGKANKCCKDSFIYAEEVYNEKLRSIQKELAKLSHSQQDACHVSVKSSDFRTNKNGKAIPRGSYPADTHIPKEQQP